jgi:hypothetical protein
MVENLGRRRRGELTAAARLSQPLSCEMGRREVSVLIERKENCKLMENHMQRVYDMFGLSVERCMCSLDEVEQIQSIGSISPLKKAPSCNEGPKRYLMLDFPQL